MNKQRLLACTLVFFGLAQTATAQRTDKIFLQGNLAGTQTVQKQPGGEVRAEYSFNDRGRGNHIVATWTLDAEGLPIAYEGRGNDYMKAPVEERFEMKDGRATWQNRSEKGEQAVNGKAFYLPLDAPPEFTTVLARALLKAPGSQARAVAGGRGQHRAERKGHCRPERADRLSHHRPRFHPANNLARTR